MSEEKKDQYIPKDEPRYKGEAKLAPIPLSVGSAPIKPNDKGKIKATAYEAMTHHANQQIGMLRRQAELLMQQAREIEERVAISRLIYEADIRFVPQVGLSYYLYETEDGRRILSMIGPSEWGKSKRFKTYVASVKLLADKTWEILDKAEDFSAD